MQRVGAEVSPLIGETGFRRKGYTFAEELLSANP